MPEPFSRRVLYAGIFVVILLLVTSSIWCVPYFIVQDGCAHLYSGYLIRELLVGDPIASSSFALNPVIVPNLTGHWLIAFLLGLFAPDTVTPIMLTGTLGLFAASVVWLRHRLTGSAGGVVTILFAFALGLNWLWLIGTYNHVIGTSLFLFSLGLFDRWRHSMNVGRTIALAAILLLAFLTHLITFLLLIGSLTVMAVVNCRDRKRSMTSLIAAALPTIPLLLAYRQLSGNEGSRLVPTWESVGDPFSLFDWSRQFVWADPFVVISRQTLPFTSVHSLWVAVLSPAVLIVGAVLLLSWERWSATGIKNLLQSPQLPVVMICAGCIAWAVVGPDHFGLENGSLIRERLLIIGLALGVTSAKAVSPLWCRRLAGMMISLVIILQTLALWEYGLLSSKVIQPFAAAAASGIAQDRTIASVSITSGEPRFHSEPTAQASSYVGVRSHAIVWDNYEFRHYMFPVITKDPSRRAFVGDLTTADRFSTQEPEWSVNEKLERLTSLLQTDNGRIDLLFLYGNDDRVNNVVTRWYSEVPIFEQGELRVLKHKDPAEQ